MKAICRQSATFLIKNKSLFVPHSSLVPTTLLLAILLPHHPSRGNTQRVVQHVPSTMPPQPCPKTSATSATPTAAESQSLSLLTRGLLAHAANIPRRPRPMPQVVHADSGILEEKEAVCQLIVKENGGEPQDPNSSGPSALADSGYEEMKTPPKMVEGVGESTPGNEETPLAVEIAAENKSVSADGGMLAGFSGCNLRATDERSEKCTETTEESRDDESSILSTLVHGTPAVHEGRVETETSWVVRTNALAAEKQPHVSQKKASEPSGKMAANPQPRRQIITSQPETHIGEKIAGAEVIAAGDYFIGWDSSKITKSRAPGPLGKQSPTIIQRGFGNFAMPKEYAVLTEVTRWFPPLSNDAYMLDTHGVSPSVFRCRSGLEDVSVTTQRIVRDKEAGRAKDAIAPGSSLGESLAKSINWDRHLYGGPRITQHEMIIATLNGSREVFVANIDAAQADGRSPFELCGKCNKRHIPLGPPATLNDRDTCRSMLPEWFPQDEYPEPWDAFIELINGYVKLDEMQKGLISNPDAKKDWDKEYHDPSNEWRAVGRIGGWWKCRIGEDGINSSVPNVERYCPVCIKASVKREKENEVKPETVSITQRKKDIEDWIHKHMNEVMKKDMAICLARMGCDVD
jgi:hypothetical protein